MIPSGSWKNRNPEAACKDLEHRNLQRSALWLSRVCKSPGNRNNRNVGSSLSNRGLRGSVDARVVARWGGSGRNLFDRGVPRCLLVPEGKGLRTCSLEVARPQRCGPELCVPGCPLSRSCGWRAKLESGGPLVLRKSTHMAVRHTWLQFWPWRVFEPSEPRFPPL